MDEIKTKSLFADFTKGFITGKAFLKLNQASLRIKTNTTTGKKSCHFALNQKDGKALCESGLLNVDVEINEYNGDLFLHFGNQGWECSVPKNTTGLKCNQQTLTIGLLQQLGYSTHEDIAVKLYLKLTRRPDVFMIERHEKI